MVVELDAVARQLCRLGLRDNIIFDGSGQRAVRLRTGDGNLPIVVLDTDTLQPFAALLVDLDKALDAGLLPGKGLQHPLIRLGVPGGISLCDSH